MFFGADFTECFNGMETQSPGCQIFLFAKSDEAQ